ncbi:S-adenosyl-L-methionine-dependent methyltransferase [Pelagophyceae sp. CCMP2097]|nr:S-adenosyl-L-methionine-dependent methyltransferase [Pelagophyceae sp. CCMP2097]
MPPQLDVGEGGGALPATRRDRKRRQLENMIGYVDALTRPGDTVVDFCCGGGHQSLPLAWLRQDVQFVLIDRKKRSLDVGRQRVDALGLSNVRFICGDVSDFVEPFDVGLSLHSCGSASDDVLDLCVARGAAFVVSPCCIGAVARETTWNETSEYPRSSALRAARSRRDYLELAAAADTNQTSLGAKGDPPSSLVNRRLCKTLVEADRLARAREGGYDTLLALMVPPSASPKNDILVGWPAASAAGGGEWQPRGDRLDRTVCGQPWIRPGAGWT